MIYKFFWAIAKFFNKLYLNRVVKDFVKGGRKLLPQKTGYTFNSDNIIFWVETDDDDFETEKKIILLMAKIQAKWGINIKPIFVEKCDRLDVPKHFTKII